VHEVLPQIVTTLLVRQRLLHWIFLSLLVPFGHL
jgi:hypothetical protein